MAERSSKPLRNRPRVADRCGELKGIEIPKREGWSSLSPNVLPVFGPTK